MKTPHIKSIRRSPLRLGFILILALACLAVPPQARAVCQEGCDLSNSNTFLGDDALLNNTIGNHNTAIGFQALYSNTMGILNTALGEQALYSNTMGILNTANGARALASNTTGSDNTANGSGALERNTTGGANTANGESALGNNTTGHENTANGLWALFANTTGSVNTANGIYALYSNTTGNSNTANGGGALENNTTGFQNAANGGNALDSNTTGYRNTADGYQALFSNTTGGRNTAEGFQALYQNTGSNNVGLGFNAGYNLTTGSNNIHIGNFGDSADTNTIRIGRLGLQTRAFMQGIRGVTTANGNAIPVLIDSAGQLGTRSSSRRFKKEIKLMDQASEAILALKPVTFHYKSDDTGTPQFGLIAEEVAEVNPDLVVRDEKGEIYTVRYEAVNAMLLNEFLKEHRTVQEQQKEIDALRAELKEQRALIQKVSDKVELNRPAPQTAENR